MIRVNEHYCPQNHPCPIVRACPVGAVTQENFYSAPKIDEEECTECGICTRMCNVFFTAA